MQDNDSGTVRGLFVGLTIGFIAGAVTALFLTTKTGEELRADIKKIALDIRNRRSYRKRNRAHKKNSHRTKRSRVEINSNIIASKYNSLLQLWIYLLEKI